MSRIKSRNTSLENCFRGVLRKYKIRFRSNIKSVIGKPDFVIHKKKIAIFCDSSFWHGYGFSRIPKPIRYNFKRNKSFWFDKIKRNIVRDKLVNKKLRSQEWRVIRFWDFQIKNSSEMCMKKIKKYIR